MKVQRSGVRALAATGALALSLVLAACGSSGSTSAGGAASGTKLDVGTGKIAVPKNTKIAMVSQSGPTLSYSAAYGKGATDAAKKLGIKLDILWANFDQGAEQSNWAQATTPGRYGGILLHPLGGAALCKAVKDTTVDKQILVVVFVNPLCGQALEYGDKLWSPGTLTYVGGQNNAPGVAAMFEAAYKKHPGPQNVMLVLGPPDHATTKLMVAEFAKFQKKHPDWKQSVKLNTDFTTPDAFKQTQNALQANPDISVAFTQYIDSSVGVAKALDAAGMTKKVPLYETGGGSKETVRLIKAGQLEGSVPSFPYTNGYVSLETMVKAFKGQQPPKFIPYDGKKGISSNYLVTPENVDSFKAEW
jgi:ribose transport system substrate-binding protein